MEHTFPGTQTGKSTVGNLQEFYSRIVEYYDELFPMDEGALSCVLRLVEQLKKDSTVSPPPIFRYLGIGCGTGTLENRLSTHNLDITGIDANADMVATAQRRIKASFSTIRFFEMNSLDIGRFLKTSSFNIIACVDNTLPYLGDRTLVRKFFHDTKKLLAPGGFLLLHVYNFGPDGENSSIMLPERSSIRVKLNRKLVPDGAGSLLLDAQLELGNGQIVQLFKSTNILPLQVSEIVEYAREAGFTGTTAFGGYGEEPLSPKDPFASIICQS